MRRFRPFLIAVVILLALVAVLSQSPRLLTPLVQHKIADSFPGTKVTIGSLSGTFFNSLIFSDIAIEDAHSKLSFKKAELRYTLPGLFKKRIESLTLQNGEAIYHGQDEPMPQFDYGSASQGAAMQLQKLSIQNLSLDIKTQDLTLDGKISFTRDMVLQRFLDGRLSVPKMALGSVTIKEFSTALDYSQHGNLSIHQVAFQKWTLDNVSATYELSTDKLLLTLSSANWLGASLKGSGQMQFSKPPTYSLRIEMGKLPLKEILTAYEWDKKVSVSGQLGGHLDIEGVGPRLTNLKGHIQNLSDGNITILDQTFLQRIADSAKQPIEIIKASFENYHYNTGDINVSLDHQNIRLGVALNGEAGKRNLEVYLHDLF